MIRRINLNGHWYSTKFVLSLKYVGVWPVSGSLFFSIFIFCEFYSLPFFTIYFFCLVFSLVYLFLSARFAHLGSRCSHAHLQSELLMLFYFTSLIFHYKTFIFLYLIPFLCSFFLGVFPSSPSSSCS